MLANLRTEVRCERHMGEWFRPRCYDCDELQNEWGELDYRLCPIHPAHLRPCTKCNG